MSLKASSHISPEKCVGKESLPLREKNDPLVFASRILLICSDISYLPIDECHRDESKRFVEVKGSGTSVKDGIYHTPGYHYIKEEDAEAAPESVEDADNDMDEVSFQSNEPNTTNHSDFTDIVDFMGSDTLLSDDTESAVGAAAREVEYRRGKGRDLLPQIISNIPPSSIEINFVPDNDEMEPGSASPLTLGMDRSTASQPLEHNADENLGAISPENDSQMYPGTHFVEDEAPIQRALRPRIRRQAVSPGELVSEGGEETSDDDIFIDTVETDLTPPRASTKHRVGSSSSKHTCTYCGKQLSSKGHLARHMYIHTGEKPYSCTLCTKRFLRSDHLKGHIRTHTGEKPVPCTLCDKRFARLGQLNTHIRTHTGEKPFPCKICHQRYSSKKSLIDHIRKHTGEKAFCVLTLW